MAKISYLDIPSGAEAAYRKGLQAGDRFTFSRVRVKSLFLSRQRIKGITQKSYLTSLAPVWQSMSSTDKASWIAAGTASGLSGWKMFVVDTVARRKAGFTGYAIPNIIFQSMVGLIEITAPATGLLLEQPHPLMYFVYKKVVGTKSQYDPVEVTESFGFPLTIGISWSTDLTATGDYPRARFFCIVYSSYQGRDIENFVEIPFSLSDSWQRATATLSGVVGPVQAYSVFIEVYNARGSLWFDNVQITHTGHNWARDPACNNTSQEFTKQYAQIPRHWAPVDITDGVNFGSVYYNGAPS